MLGAGDVVAQMLQWLQDIDEGAHDCVKDNH